MKQRGLDAPGLHSKAPMLAASSYLCRERSRLCSQDESSITDRARQARGCSPTRARRMAREMATTASSCPMTRLCSVCSILIRRSLSSLLTFSIGMPAQQREGL